VRLRHGEVFLQFEKTERKLGAPTRRVVQDEHPGKQHQIATLTWGLYETGQRSWRLCSLEGSLVQEGTEVKGLGGKGPRRLRKQNNGRVRTGDRVSDLKNPSTGPGHEKQKNFLTTTCPLAEKRTLCT